MKLEGKSELFRALGRVYPSSLEPSPKVKAVVAKMESLSCINTDVPREPDRCQPCPECGDGYKDCKCPLADTYRQTDGSDATNCDGFSPCPRCMGTGYRRDWQGRKVQCDDCWNDQTESKR
jgi:hypothetical protein